MGLGLPGFRGFWRPQHPRSPTAGGWQGEAGCSGEPTSQDGSSDRRGLRRALGPQCGPAGHGLSLEERQSQGQGPAQGVGLSGVRELTSFAPTLFCTSYLPSGLQTPPLWPQGTTGALRHAQTLCVFRSLAWAGGGLSWLFLPVHPPQLSSVSSGTHCSLQWPSALQHGQEPLPSPSTPSHGMSSPECRWSVCDGRDCPPSSPLKSEPHC